MHLRLPGKPALLSLCSLVLLTIAGMVSYAKSQSGEDRGAESNSIRGKVSLEVPGVIQENVGPIVVFLEPQDVSVKPRVPEKPAIINQEDVKFIPDFLVVCVGQTVEMPNNDKIMHNAFSFSKPNAFDLGIYPKGETKKLTFLHAGVVDLYCSIHAKMNGVIYVAPSPYHAQVDTAGSFEIRDVPAGKYVLKTWNRKIPEAQQTIEIVQGKAQHVSVKIQAGNQKQ